MFQNWTARVEGKLTSKDNQSFIITNVIKFVSATGSADIKDANDGKALQIVYIKDKTVFQKINPKKEGEFTPIDLPGLPLGSLVNGTIEIYKTGESMGESNVAANNNKGATNLTNLFDPIPTISLKLKDILLGLMPSNPSGFPSCSAFITMSST